MRAMVNPTGKHRRKRRHHGEGTVILRRDRWRARPWAAVVPYLDESGCRREMWLSAASRDFVRVNVAHGGSSWSIVARRGCHDGCHDGTICRVP